MASVELSKDNFDAYCLIATHHDYIHDCTCQGGGTGRVKKGFNDYHRKYVRCEDSGIFYQSGSGKKQINQKGGNPINVNFIINGPQITVTSPDGNEIYNGTVSENKNTYIIFQDNKSQKQYTINNITYSSNGQNKGTIDIDNFGYPTSTPFLPRTEPTRQFMTAFKEPTNLSSEMDTKFEFSQGSTTGASISGYSSDSDTSLTSGKYFGPGKIPSNNTLLSDFNPPITSTASGLSQNNSADFKSKIRMVNILDNMRLMFFGFGDWKIIPDILVQYTQQKFQEFCQQIQPTNIGLEDIILKIYNELSGKYPISQNFQKVFQNVNNPQQLRMFPDGASSPSTKRKGNFSNITEEDDSSVISESSVNPESIYSDLGSQPYSELMSPISSAQSSPQAKRIRTGEQQSPLAQFIIHSGNLDFEYISKLIDYVSKNPINISQNNSKIILPIDFFGNYVCRQNSSSSQRSNWWNYKDILAISIAVTTLIISQTIIYLKLNITSVGFSSVTSSSSSSSSSSQYDFTIPDSGEIRKLLYCFLDEIILKEAYLKCEVNFYNVISDVYDNFTNSHKKTSSYMPSMPSMPSFSFSSSSSFSPSSSQQLCDTTDTNCIVIDYDSNYNYEYEFSGKLIEFLYQSIIIKSYYKALLIYYNYSDNESDNNFCRTTSIFDYFENSGNENENIMLDLTNILVEQSIFDHMYPRCLEIIKKSRNSDDMYGNFSDFSDELSELILDEYVKLTEAKKSPSQSQNSVIYYDKKGYAADPFAGGSINETNIQNGGRITQQQRDEIITFIKENYEKWKTDIQNSMTGVWNNDATDAQNPLNNIQFYKGVLNSILSSVGEISEADKKSFEKFLKKISFDAFPGIAIRKSQQYKLEKYISRAVSQLDLLLNNVQDLARSIYKPDPLEKVAKIKKIKEISLVGKDNSLSPKKEGTYALFPQDKVVFNNVTRMIAASGLMGIGYIDSNFDIIIPNGSGTAYWSQQKSSLLRMEIDNLFKEVTKNIFKCFGETILKGDIDSRLEVGIKKIYQNDPRVLIGDEDEGRDDISTKRKSLSNSILSKNSQFMKGQGDFSNPTYNTRGPIYIDNARQGQSELFGPILNENYNWPKTVVCNVPGLVDGWQAVCSWNSCITNSKTDKYDKYLELPQENSSMTFNVLCSEFGVNYTYTTTRIGNNGELVINLGTSIMHLGQPYGFYCDKANYQDAWALEATRVYDKQLQILLHKFKEYRQNLQPISNYSRLLVKPEPQFAKNESDILLPMTTQPLDTASEMQPEAQISSPVPPFEPSTPVPPFEPSSPTTSELSYPVLTQPSSPTTSELSYPVLTQPYESTIESSSSYPIPPQQPFVQIYENSPSYTDLFGYFLTDGTPFNATNNNLFWLDGTPWQMTEKNPVNHFMEFGGWKACADNNIISSAVSNQIGLYNGIQPIQQQGNVAKKFQNPLQQSRTMVQIGTDRPAQMGQVAALVLESLNIDENNTQLLIGNSSSNPKSYFYVLPRVLWGYNNSASASAFGYATKPSQVFKNNPDISSKRSRNLGNESLSSLPSPSHNPNNKGGTIKNKRTYRKYKNTKKYNSYRKSHTKNKKINKKYTRKHKKMHYKKHSRRI